MEHQTIKKKRIVLYFISIALLTLNLFSGCYYDKEEELYPEVQTCDTLNVTFSSIIQPILQSRCTGCHSGASPSAGIDLSTHANVQTSAQNGKLVGVIDHQPGFSAMPQGTPKMPDCEINKIKKWVNNGSPNN